MDGEAKWRDDRHARQARKGGGGRDVRGKHSIGVHIEQSELLSDCCRGRGEVTLRGSSVCSPCRASIERIPRVGRVTVRCNASARNTTHARGS